MATDSAVVTVKVSDIPHFAAELAAAYDAIRDLVHATAGHVGCRVCKERMSRHAETIVKAKGALRVTDRCPKSPDGRHAWGSDGAHTNTFCKRCFVNP